jgi:hypothetical protein
LVEAFESDVLSALEVNEVLDAAKDMFAQFRKRKPTVSAGLPIDHGQSSVFTPPRMAKEQKPQVTAGLNMRHISVHHTL